MNGTADGSDTFKKIWRGDAQRGLYFGGLLSTSQILAIVAGLWALGMLIAYRLKRREPAAP
jgi:hypothetical protein